MEKFKNSMAHDFKQFKNLIICGIQHNVLNHINNILHSMGHVINEFQLTARVIQSSEIEKEPKKTYNLKEILLLMNMIYS